jgi:hypothetical protein
MLRHAPRVAQPIQTPYSSGSTSRPSAVTDVTAMDWRRVSLGSVFAAGARAIVLADARAQEVWGDLAPLFDPSISLLDAARNHRRREMRYGDILRFIPGETAHLARKLIIVSSDGGRTLTALPDGFACGAQRIVPPARTLRAIWDLMSELLEHTLEARDRPARYVVGVEHLMYPRSPEELEQVFELLADSAGTWTRLGRRVDAGKGAMVGLLNRFVVRDFAGLAAAMGGLRVVQRIDRLRWNRTRDEAPAGRRPVLKAHVDSAKILTALVGDRRRLKTEVFDGRAWVDLPVTTDAVALLPSLRIHSRSKIQPTCHRVVMSGDSPDRLPHVEHTLALTIAEPGALLAAARNPS